MFKFRKIFLHIRIFIHIFAADKNDIPTQIQNLDKMEQEKVKKQLPDSITLKDEYGKMLKSWMAALGNAQRAYDYLLNDKDVGGCIPEFDKLDSVWIKSFVQQKVDAVMQSPHPFSARTEAADEWRAVERDLLSKVKDIEDLRGIDSDLMIEVKGTHITISNMEALLHTRTEFVVPESFKSFYQIAVSCADQLKRLHEIQQSWGIAAPPIINSVAVQLANDPTEFIYFCIRIQKQQEWLMREKQPSKIALENQRHKDELKRKEEERKKRQQEAHDQLVREGKQADYGVSIRETDGKLVPVK